MTVTATRSAERLFDVPASADIVSGTTIRDGQPAISLSESLVRVPGLFAANRNNYAQDLQLSSRGYGARATFGVRGVRLYQDDIPVTMPDGQGQTGSFSLFSAQRIEVLRGPFSTLYGNASGGVVSVYTEDGTPEPVFDVTASVGSYRTSNTGVKATGIAGGVGYVAAFSNFDTNGYRDHSEALRQIANAKLAFNATDSTHVTVIGSSQYQPETQDPLGLTYAQWQANPQAGRSRGDAVQHPQDDQPGARRRRGRPGARCRYQCPGDRLLRASACTAVPRLDRDPGRPRREVWSISIAITVA